MKSLKTSLQTFCVTGVACGIVIEYFYQADMGFMLITAGALAFAISTKIENRVKKI